MNIRDNFKSAIAAIISLQPTYVDIVRTLAGSNFSEQVVTTTGKIVCSINEFKHNRVVDAYEAPGSSVWHSHILHVLSGAYTQNFTPAQIANIYTTTNLAQGSVIDVDVNTFKLQDLMRQYNSSGQVIATYRVLSPIVNVQDGVIEVNVNLLVNAPYA